MTCQGKFLEHVHENVLNRALPPVAFALAARQGLQPNGTFAMEQVHHRSAVPAVGVQSDGLTTILRRSDCDSLLAAHRASALSATRSEQGPENTTKTYTQTPQADSHHPDSHQACSKHTVPEPTAAAQETNNTTHLPQGGAAGKTGTRQRADTHDMHVPPRPRC